MTIYQIITVLIHPLTEVGAPVGMDVGRVVGEPEGTRVGCTVGNVVGAWLGEADGALLGLVDGVVVGAWGGYRYVWSR